jgi:hypothetical protein
VVDNSDNAEHYFRATALDGRHTVLEMRGVAIHVSRARIYATMTDRASHFCDLNAIAALLRA